MDQVKMIADVVKDIRSLADSLQTMADVMAEKDTSVVTDVHPEKEKKVLSLEDVRAVLAEKSREGKTAEVKELLVRFGANRLSEINPECYTELLKAAVEL